MASAKPGAAGVGVAAKSEDDVSYYQSQITQLTEKIQSALLDRELMSPFVSLPARYLEQNRKFPAADSSSFVCPLRQTQTLSVGGLFSRSVWTADSTAVISCEAVHASADTNR